MIFMSNEIKKIDSIKNMAVFQDFHWNSSVRDEGNNIVEFKKFNIFYGRNYSGKTTLSRIFRGLETGIISEKYASPEFQLSFEDGSKVSQNTLTGHGQIIRVFNEDFVKENLRFVVDDEYPINSFAILGEDNTKLEEEMAQHEVDLGSEENRTGLVGKMVEKNEEYQEAERAYRDNSSALEDRLRDKANNSRTGIKHNKIFGDANYNINKMRDDIATVFDESYSPNTPEQIGEYRELLKEEPKPNISESAPFNLLYANLATNTKRLVEKKIQISDPIQELLNNAVLETWVRTGREYHEGKRSKCAFCGSSLPPDLWKRLDKHFNKESEELRVGIEQLISSIEDEKTHAPKLLSIKTNNFYSNFNSDLEKLKEQFDANSISYIESLDVLKSQLEKRKNDIFNSRIFVEPVSVEQSFSGIRRRYEILRDQSNRFTKALSGKQSKARTELRLHEVFTFVNAINYSGQHESIEILSEALRKAETAKKGAILAVADIRSKISTLKAQLKDESKGADRVNDYLNNFFGHQFLTLKAIKHGEGEDEVTGYRFVVTRNGEKAHHLSQGECGLVAFCYFMAKLDDVDTKGLEPIIWIDDPVSSLDANHNFFVYSLINAEIVKPMKFKQLFISTHNLDFLKYLKRLSSDHKGKGQNKIKLREFFLIERNVQDSNLTLMPDYLKNYVTEFNYLFHQIYKCAKANGMNDQNYQDFYNFGNNARKFLEIYLYYKYPNGIDNDEKLLKFFGHEQIPAIFTDRVNNEYSHLGGVFERGASPIEVPEMQSVAKQILSRIEEDEDQYNALLQSIGSPQEPIIAKEGM